MAAVYYKINISFQMFNNSLFGLFCFVKFPKILLCYLFSLKLSFFKKKTLQIRPRVSLHKLYNCVKENCLPIRPSVYSCELFPSFHEIYFVHITLVLVWGFKTFIILFQEKLVSMRPSVSSCNLFLYHKHNCLFVTCMPETTECQCQCQ